MKQYSVFLPCSAGCEDFLADEVGGLLGLPPERLRVGPGGVGLQASLEQVWHLNLGSRLALRVLIELARGHYRDEQDIYALAAGVAWERWFVPAQTFKVGISAHASPLRSLRFATLRVKDAVADRFRARSGGVRPSVDTRHPHIRVHAHLDREEAGIYIDSSGEPLFKRGWRQKTGDAPLKETLASAMLAACGWWQPRARQVSDRPLYDPCCGSGTIVIEAAQLAAGMLPGGRRSFAFEHFRDFHQPTWRGLKARWELAARCHKTHSRVFGSDLAHRMVDFAQHNARRAGVDEVVTLRGGDALQRQPPVSQAGILLLNPPYGQRIEAKGVAGQRHRQDFVRPVAARSSPDGDGADTFYPRLAMHWKHAYGGWTAWVLSPDRGLPGHLRMKATRRVPLYNGPLDCRLFRFDIRPLRQTEQQAEPEQP